MNRFANDDGAWLALGALGLLAGGSALVRRGSAACHCISCGDLTEQGLWAGPGKGALCQACHRQGRAAARFITDAGIPLIATDTVTGEQIDLGRYGVWGDTGHHIGKAEVLETGNDLDALQAIYGPGLPVYPLPGGKGSAAARSRGDPITVHQWLRDGRLVRLLRTDAPGFRTEYLDAKRRYGLPTHSRVI